MFTSKIKTKSERATTAVQSPARILGLDPGYGRLGYGLIEEEKGVLRPVSYGCFETAAREDRGYRLQILRSNLLALLKRHRPAVAGVEQLFFSKNVKTALGVGEARGVILLTLAEERIPVFEVSPQQVKLAVTGYGKAGKRQMQTMVAKLLGLVSPPKPDDAADALAVAMAVSQTHRTLGRLMNG
ncbi:crossover junction endodeoxyribonuclease RuvC [Candidatus Uhrbacteria bacterium]|nr:crossover junction endodeoxyribonuclease RuvC [Candidatus Uhrbacteria bacterium]